MQLILMYSGHEESVGAKAFRSPVQKNNITNSIMDPELDAPTLRPMQYLSMGLCVSFPLAQPSTQGDWSSGQREPLELNQEYE